MLYSMQFLPEIEVVLFLVSHPHFSCKLEISIATFGNPLGERADVFLEGVGHVGTELTVVGDRTELRALRARPRARLDGKTCN